MAQAGFKKTLIKEVSTFTVDARNFRTDWEANGPMVPNLAPLEAVERLKKFQQLFEVGAVEACVHACGIQTWLCLVACLNRGSSMAC